MAEPTGTARQEAERLVATVLAMASQAGLGGPPRDPDPDQESGRESGRDTDPAASPGLGDLISGLVGQFLGGDTAKPSSTTPPRRSEPDQRPDSAQQSAAQEPADQHATGWQAANRQPADQHAADQHAADQHAADRQATTGRSAADRQASDPQGSGTQGAGQPGGTEQGRDRQGAGRQGRDSRGAGGLGGVWQAAGQQLWEDVGRRNGWSTGSAECCICPICRGIAGMRDPSPERAERLATGAGDFASSVASMLRAVSVMTGATGTANRQKPPARPTTTPDQAWSAATRTTEPAGRAAPEREVREGDDPWAAATRAPRPQPAEARPDPATTPTGSTHRTPPADPPAAQATAPTDATTRTAAEQAAAQTDALDRPAQTDATGRPAQPDATGRTAQPDATGRPAQPDATGRIAQPVEEAAPPPRPSGDPWAAATRTPPRTGAAGKPRPAAPWPGAGSTSAPTRNDSIPPDGSIQAAQAAAQSDAEPTATDTGTGTGAWTVTPGGDVSEPAQPSTPEVARPAAEPAESTDKEPLRDSAAAVEGAAARTGKGSSGEERAGKGPTGTPDLAGEDARVTVATDVWAAATAANGDTAGDTGVADKPSLDHDVPGTAPAASAAEGRGAGSGDDARAGDAV